MDSPFRHYRESYIGALRSGSDVPLARELDAELTGQDGYHSPSGGSSDRRRRSRPGSRTPDVHQRRSGTPDARWSVIPERAPHGMAPTAPSGPGGPYAYGPDDALDVLTGMVEATSNVRVRRHRADRQ